MKQIMPRCCLPLCCLVLLALLSGCGSSTSVAEASDWTIPLGKLQRDPSQHFETDR